MARKGPRSVLGGGLSGSAVDVASGSGPRGSGAVFGVLRGPPAGAIRGVDRGPFQGPCGGRSGPVSRPFWGPIRVRSGAPSWGPIRSSSATPRPSSGSGLGRAAAGGRGPYPDSWDPGSLAVAATQVLRPGAGVAPTGIDSQRERPLHRPRPYPTGDRTTSTELARLRSLRRAPGIDERPPDRRAALDVCGHRARWPVARSLDRVTDPAEDGADLAAQEKQGKDGDDGDEGKDQCVLGQPLAIIVKAGWDDPRAERFEHRYVVLLSRESPALGREHPVPRSSGTVIGPVPSGGVATGATHYGVVGRPSIRR
jgi:hypothetical protein